jgi:hypothetical protein
MAETRVRKEKDQTLYLENWNICARRKSSVGHGDVKNKLKTVFFTGKEQIACSILI